MAVYLDYNATTPVDPRALDEMINVYKNNYGNADSRTHKFGQAAESIVDQARSRIASILSINKSEIIFTSGATESDNLAILGLAKWGQQNNRMHIISTKIEHKAILEPLNHLAQSGFDVEFVDIDQSGRVDANHILDRVRPDTLLVSMMHANNETGVIQPIMEVGEALDQTKTYFHIDAAQTFGKLVDDLKSVKYDLLSISAHKVFGPQGVGALILKKKKYRRPPVQPITFGGNQELGLRPGTLPVALISGFGKAAEIAEQEHEQWLQTDLAIKDKLLSQLNEIDHVINGDQNHCMAHTLNVSFPGVNSEGLMLALNDQYAISNGSACTAHDYSPSHVLTAMRLRDEIIESAIRLSWSSFNKNIDLSYLVEVVKQKR